MASESGNRHHPRAGLALLLAACLLLVSGCGYRNPYAGKDSYSGPPRTLYLEMWDNHTNELGLESTYHRALAAWFRKTPHIRLTADRGQAELLLSGDIVAIDIPGLFYGRHEEARGVKAVLTVRYQLARLDDNTLLWRQDRRNLEEPFLLDNETAVTRDNKRRALVRIGDELAETIYLRTLEALVLLPSE